jgi:hypothetical protein
MQNFENGTNGVEETVVADTLAPVINLIENSIEYQELDAVGRDRFAVLSSIYSNDNTFAILRLVEQYGINTYNNVLLKTNFIQEEKHKEEYFQAIAEEIIVGKVYGTVGINRFIATLRKKLNMKPYLKDVVKKCALDFLQMHIAAISYSDWNDPKTGKPVILGYAPKLNLDCQI